jgi:hypothetical protein
LIDRRWGCPFFELGPKVVLESALSANQIDCAILRRLKNPGVRIVRHPEAPSLHRADECVMNDVFRKRDVARTEHARQRSNEMR